MINKAIKLSLVATGLVVCAQVSSANAPETDSITSLPMHEMKFDVSPEGVGFTKLEGDRFEEPYMAMVRLPAGLESPPHIKSANMFGIIISGAMINSAVGAKDSNTDIILTPGSFYKIPANLPHVSRCVSDVECVTFLYQDGKFDFNMVPE